MSKRKIARAENPVIRLKTIIRTRLGHAINGRAKSGKTMSYLGCSVEHLRAHIEARWLPGMSWENYGPKGWHIDHKKPLASFELFNVFGGVNEEQLKVALNYTNLQPLWAADNLRKGASLTAS